MNVGRQGWAKAVGSVYLTRDGREVRITHYSVTVREGDIIRPEADLLGETEAGLTVDYDEDGNCSHTYDPEQAIVYVGAVRQGHPLDLVEAKQH